MPILPGAVLHGLRLADVDAPELICPAAIIAMRISPAAIIAMRISPAAIIAMRISPAPH